MRRVRALLQLVRPGAARADAAPADGPGRRAVLGLIGAAPIALPAALNASASRAMQSGSHLRILSGDLQVGVLSPGSISSFKRSELDALGDFSSSKYEDVEKRRMLEQQRISDLGLGLPVQGPSWPVLSATTVSAFIDDVGSGP